MNEAEYLLAAAPRFVTPGVAPLPPTGCDYGILLRLARAHGVALPLARALPVEARTTEWSLAAGAQVRQGLRRAADLAQTAGILQARGVPFLALKGPLLSLRLHGDPALRSSGDLDLLVRSSDLAAAIAALSAAGFALEAPPGWPPATACRASREAEVYLAPPADASPVDLHWRCLPPYFPNPLGAGDTFAWRTPAEFTLAGRRLATLHDDALLLLLCAHAAKHCFERLSWVWDIAACLAARPGYGWESALEQARASHTTRMLGLGLRLAAAIFGVSGPDPPPDPIADALCAQVLARYVAGRSGHTPADEEIPFVWRLLERPRQRLRYLLGQLEPSGADFHAWRLPAGLRGLYYPFRLGRLAWRLTLRRCFTGDRQPMTGDVRTA